MTMPPIDIPRLLRALGIGRAMATEPPRRVYVVEEPLPYDLVVIDGPLVELDNPVIEQRGNVVNVSVAGKVRAVSLAGLRFTHRDYPGERALDAIQRGSIITDGLLDMDAVRAAGDQLGQGDPLGFMTSVPSLPSPEDQERASRQIMDSIRQMMRMFAGPWYVVTTDINVDHGYIGSEVYDSIEDARQAAAELNHDAQGEGDRLRVFRLQYLEG